MDNRLLITYLACFLVCFGLTVLLERLILPRLRGCAKQPIYTDGPRWHASKSGTPTMGGLAFIIAIDTALVIFALFLMRGGQTERAWLLIASVVYATLNGAVGIVDDIKKLRRKENAGLSPVQKLLLQGVLAALYMLSLGFIGVKQTVFAFSFGDFDLSLFYYPVALIILLGITNCANLTDGVDGLASSVAFGIGMALLLVSHTVLPDVSLTGVALMGGASGFLVYNLNPAKVFMGDTGSLYLGAMVAASAFAFGNPLLAVVLGVVYVIEGISVILQVIFFKITGRRIFRMAPLHHHLEKSGWSESGICIAALLLTLAFSLPAMLLVGGVL